MAFQLLYRKEGFRKKFQILFDVKTDDNNNVDFDSFFIALLNRVLWMPADYRYC